MGLTTDTPSNNTTRIAGVLGIIVLLSIALSGSAESRQDSGAVFPEVGGTAGPGEEFVAADSEYVPRTAVPRFSADTILRVLGKETERPADDSPYRPDSYTDTIGASFEALSVYAGTQEKDRGQPLPERLYPGVSPEQHLLARQMLDFFFDADWDSSENAAKKLQKLEKKNHLPPLSALLMVGIRVLRVLHGEYENDREKKALIRDADKIAAKGLELADPNSAPDSCRATSLLISGGIQGFSAALEIDRNPINAAINGLSSLKFFKRAVELDTIIRDAYLGVAMYNCFMSRAPAVVRGALAVIGKKVSLEKGLDYLRACAYGGHYTNEVAQLLLIEFLSPHLGHEAEEKELILQSLQRRYPHNPFYVFLDFDENLCFHPGKLSGFSFKNRVRRQIAGFTMSNSSSRCYANLVKWQYLLLDPFAEEEFAPDKEFWLRRFSYYPVFLQAVREKIADAGEDSEANADRARRQRFIQAMGARAERMLDASNEMPQNRKGFYLWHIRDALKITTE